MDDDLLSSVPAEVDVLRIDGLQISTRLRNALRRAGVERLGDLRGVSETDLERRIGFGRVTIAELRTLINSRLGWHLSGGPSEVEDRELATASSETALQTLGADTSFVDSLELLGIRTIGELQGVPERILTAPGVLGPDAKTDLDRIFASLSLSPLYSDIPDGTPEGDPTANNEAGTLSACLKDFFNAVSPRERDIVLSRLGYSGAAPTLERIGKDIDLTRERVRQLEVRGLSVLENQIGGELRNRMSILLKDRTEPLFTDFLPVYDDWFDLLDVPSTFYEGLIKKLLRGELYVVGHGRRNVIARLPKPSLQPLVDLVIQSASALVGEGVDREAIGLLSRAIATDAGAPEITQILIEKAFAVLHFSPDESQILIGVGRGMERKVEAALRYAGEPKHYSEVVEIVHEITGRRPDERRVHSALGESEAVLVARGTFALPQQIKIAPAVREEVVSLTLEIMRSGPEGKQWHCHELLESLTEQLGEIPGIDSGHLLSAILRNVPGLQDLGRQVWVYVGSKKSSGINRVDLRQACESIIRDTGRPMTRAELVQALEKRRGTSSNFQIHSAGNLIQLGSGLWALRDRDLGISMDKQAAAQDRLVECLQERRKSIHVSEVPAVIASFAGDISSIDADVLIGLARIDPRLRVYMGQFVGIAEWDEPRRLTTVKALRQIGASRIEELEDEPLVREVELLVERPVTLLEVQNALPGVFEDDS